MSFAFDQYQRYKHVEEIVNLIRNGNKSVKILEVGANEHKNLQKFLPLDEIMYLDIELPDHLKEDKQYILADATNMPEILDNSYDVVIALDVFEHIPGSLRDNFIAELHRVAAQGVIIAAPFNKTEVVDAEVRANEYFRQLYGSGFRWLEEHRENGLPDFIKTKSYYEKSGYSFTNFEHGSLEIWEKMMGLHFLFADKPTMHPNRLLIDDYYNKNVYPIDYSKSNYRTFFVSLNDELKIAELNKWIDGRIEHSKTAFEEVKHLNWLEEQLKNVYAVKQMDGLNNKVNETVHNLNVVKADLNHKIQINHDVLMHNINEIQTSVQSFMISQNEALLADRKYLLESMKEIISSESNKLRLEINSNINQLSQMKSENDELRYQLQLKENHIVNIETLNDTMKRTKGWRALEKFRTLKNLIKRNKHTIVPKVVNKVKTEGLKSTISTIESKLQNELQELPYNEWYIQNQLSTEDLKTIKDEIKLLKQKPLISIVVPTYNTPLNLLDEAIESVKKQLYTNWELCICDDQSPNKDVWERLQYHAKLDSRIKIIKSPDNLHIAGATNLAITLATGEYVGFLDHDDVLTEDALYEVVKVINKTNADVIYSDEDKLEMDGTYSDPFFKPDWSPDYLLSTNYICHFAVYRKTLGDSLGWIQKGYDGAQDYDFVLRFTELAENIQHISKVLYHWRKIPGSTAESFGSKSYAQIAGKNAVAAAIKRRGVDGVVEENVIPGHYIVKRNLTIEPKVSIIIPTKDKIDLVEVCVSSILAKTTYSNYEIIVINNQSEEKATYDYFEKMKDKLNVLNFDKAFNYSEMNNFAVEHTTGEFLMFLNNDTEVIEPDWLTRMVEHGVRSEVGVVGAKLLYTNNKIQHAGVILGVGGVANHAFLNLPKESHGYFGMLRDIRNCSAVTAACLLMRRDVFNEVNGFNERDLKVAFNDVDLCLKVRAKGYLCVWTPLALLYHHESATRTRDVDLTEVDYMIKTWSYELENDPYYNHNFSRQEVVNSYTVYK